MKEEKKLLPEEERLLADNELVGATGGTDNDGTGSAKRPPFARPGDPRVITNWNASDAIPATPGAYVLSKDIPNEE